MTKGQYDYAKQQVLCGVLSPTNYNRNPSGRDGGLTFKDLCILNSFLHYVCSESSESQHVSGTSLLFSWYYLVYCITESSFLLTEGRGLSLTDTCAKPTTPEAATSCTCDCAAAASGQRSTIPHGPYNRESFLQEMLTPSGVALINDVIAGQIDITDWKSSTSKGSSIVLWFVTHFFLRFELFWSYFSFTPLRQRDIHPPIAISSRPNLLKKLTIAIEVLLLSSKVDNNAQA